MRTLQNRASSAVRNALVGPDCPCNVRGTISFVFTATFENPNPAFMRNIIYKMTWRFPWKDGAVEDKSGFISDGEVVTHNFHIKESVCVFSLNPSVSRISRGKVLAYEKYLATIAHELAKLDIPGVSMVRCKVESYTIYEFPIK